MFSNLSLIFSLAPITRGFIAMIISGTFFPLCGLMVLRLDLIPLRYMLMHGVILGGALSLALNLPLFPVTLTINLLLIFIMMFFNKSQSFGFSGASAASMVLSMALASILMQLADVPAKDTLNLMWGSPFALTKSDLLILIAISILLLSYIIFNFKNILALFFNKDVAKAIGIKVRLNYTFMILIIALLVALAMKLLGAFLIDSLLILPVLNANLFCGKKSSGIKKLFVTSSIFGLVISLLGYSLAVIINWPPAATISLLAVIIYIVLSFGKRSFK